MLGFNVDNSTAALTALATNPMAIGTGASSRFVGLDPSNNFILSPVDRETADSAS